MLPASWRGLGGIHYLFIAALFAMMLVCGVFWGLYFALSRSYQVFNPVELAKIARTTVRNLEVPMRNISILCLALMGACIAVYPNKVSWNFYALTAPSRLYLANRYSSKRLNAMLKPFCNCLLRRFSFLGRYAHSTIRNRPAAR